MTFQRLTPEQPEGWALWPVFEARVLAFLHTVARETPAPTFLAWLRKTFVETPALLGAWLAIDEGQSVGHFLGWADVFFGEPFIWVHQAQVDERTALGRLRHAMVAELKQWVDEMNWAYEQQGVPTRIRRMRFATERDAEAWARYLDPLGSVTAERVVLSIALTGSEPRRAAMPPLVLPPWQTTTNGTAHVPDARRETEAP